MADVGRKQTRRRDRARNARAPRRFMPNPEAESPHLRGERQDRVGSNGPTATTRGVGTDRVLRRRIHAMHQARGQPHGVSAVYGELADNGVAAVRVGGASLANDACAVRIDDANQGARALLGWLRDGLLEVDRMSRVRGTQRGLLRTHIPRALLFDLVARAWRPRRFGRRPPGGRTRLLGETEARVTRIVADVVNHERCQPIRKLGTGVTARQPDLGQNQAAIAELVDLPGEAALAYLVAALADPATSRERPELREERRRGGFLDLDPPAPLVQLERAEAGNPVAPAYARQAFAQVDAGQPTLIDLGDVDAVRELWKRPEQVLPAVLGARVRRGVREELGGEDRHVFAEPFDLLVPLLLEFLEAEADASMHPPGELDQPGSHSSSPREPITLRMLVAREREQLLRLLQRRIFEGHGELAQQDVAVVEVAQHVLQAFAALDDADRRFELRLHGLDEIAQALAGDPRPMAALDVVRRGDLTETLRELAQLLLRLAGQRRAEDRPGLGPRRVELDRHLLETRGELAVDELEGPPRLLSQLGHGAREPPFEAPDQPVVAAPLTAIQLISLRGEPRKGDLGVAAAAGGRLKGAQRTPLALADARLELLGPSARRAAETADRHAEVVERLRILPVLETLGRRAGLGQQIQRDVACGLTGRSTQNVRGHPHPGLRSSAR